MKRILGLLLVMVVATGMFAATTQPAAAKSGYVSSKYQGPKKGQTSSAVTSLQYRLVKAKALDSKYITAYFGPITEKGVKKFQKSAKLKQSGKVDKTTWKALVKRTGTISKPKAPKAKGIDKRCAVTSRSLCIDKTKSKLYYVKNGKIIRTFDARFGGPGYRTREGQFSVLWKSRNHVSTIYHTSMPYAMFFSGGQAVHYSPDFAARGYNGSSHGCVNIRNRSGIARVFDQMRNGDRVVVYRS